MNYFGHDYFALNFKKEIDDANLKNDFIHLNYLDNICNKENEIPSSLQSYISSTMLGKDFFGLALHPIGSYQLNIINNLNDMEFNIPHSVTLDNAGVSEFIIFNLVLPKLIDMSIVESQNSIKKEITLNQLQEYTTDKQKFYLYNVCWDFLDDGHIELHLNFATSSYYTNENKSVSLSLKFFEKDIITAKLCMPNHEDTFYDALKEDAPYVRGYDRYKKILSIINSNFKNKEYVFI